MAKAKNNGKKFEKEFRESFPDYVWTYRPPDIGGGQLARFTNESLCDLIAFNTKEQNLSLFELKSTVGTSVGFPTKSECDEYEKDNMEFKNWKASLSVNERKFKKEEIKIKRNEIKLKYKKLNSKSIKYHQIKALELNQNKYDNINCYIIFTFIEKNATYAFPINNFLNFWNITTKKSINETDLIEYVDNKKAYLIQQEYIGRSKNFNYKIDCLLTK